MDSSAGPIAVSAIDHVGLTAQLVAAYVAHNSVPVSDLPGLIGDTHAALVCLGDLKSSPSAGANRPTATQIRGSITPEALISFEDGRPYKTLRRHLTLRGLSAEAYRRKWGLPGDYPMTAASYSARRSALAKSFGLGLPRVMIPASAPGE
ncbi:MucR family transcriptional regulator [Methylobacterium sp. D54C]